MFGSQELGLVTYSEFLMCYFAKCLLPLQLVDPTVFESHLCQDRMEEPVLTVFEYEHLYVTTAGIVNELPMIKDDPQAVSQHPGNYYHVKTHTFENCVRNEAECC